MSTQRDSHEHQLEGLDHLDAVAGDERWVGGELEVVEERPTHNLETDPAQRKWMMLGFGACAVATLVAVVLLLGRGDEASAAADATATDEAAVPSAEAQADDAPAPTVEAEPTLATGSPKAASIQGVAAKARGSSKSPAKAPPQPAAPTKGGAASSSTPASTPMPAPSTPEGTQPAKPGLPAAEPDTKNSLADLPDVSGWDEADAEVDAKTQKDAPAPSAPADPPDLAEAG